MNTNIVANSILSLLSIGTLAYLSRSQHPRQNPSSPPIMTKADLMRVIVDQYITDRTVLAKTVKIDASTLKSLLDSYGFLVPRATGKGQIVVKTKPDGTKVLMISKKKNNASPITLTEIPKPTRAVSASENYYDYIKKIQEEEEREEDDEEALSTYSTKSQPSNGKERQRISTSISSLKRYGSR